MAIKGYFTFIKSSGLRPHHLIACVISRTLVWQRFYPSAEMQSAYSTAPANWVAEMFQSTQGMVVHTIHPLEMIWLFHLCPRVFANGLRDLGSIPGCIIPNTLKVVLDTSLFNTWQYKVCIEGKVEQSRERGSALP